MAESIDDLLARGDAGGLAKLAESADKATAKAARRALHVLRTKGVKVAAPAPLRQQAPVARPQAAELPCLASSIDAGGERALWLGRSDPSGGVIFYQAYLHEEHGITQFGAAEMSRKQFRKLVREMVAPKPNFAVAEVPWDYARSEVEEAYRRNLKSSRAAPVEFTRVRTQLGPARPFERHPALSLWPEVPEVSREAILGLHELPECSAWMPDRAELDRTAMKLHEVETSQLLVGDQQKRAAAADALARSVQEYFADARNRERMQRRLLDTAYLLHQEGKDEQGRIARAAAEAFASAESAAASPFAQRLFEKCFHLPGGGDEPAEPERPSGLIVPP